MVHPFALCIPRLSKKGAAMQLMREGYHEQLFLLTNEQGEPIVRKQAKPRPDGTLLTEIAWLEEVPPRYRQFFPRVLNSHKQADGQPIFYEMPYFGQEWVVLSDLILTGAIDRSRALTLLARVMRVMFDGIFPLVYPQETAAYPDRLLALLEHGLLQILKLEAFRPFLFSESVVINGEPCHNVFSLLEAIRGNSSLQETLCPRVVRKVHGDLYPENILIRLPSLRRAVPQVMILDPIAAIGLKRGDFAMDIAKCKSWLSAELLALRLGLFTITAERSTAPSFTMMLHMDDAQLRALSDGFLLHDFLALFGSAKWSRTICDEDSSWWRRVSFYEALYALSMVPLVPAWQSLARFLVGIRHLNDFVSMQDGQEFSVPYSQLSAINDQ